MGHPLKMVCLRGIQILVENVCQSFKKSWSEAIGYAVHPNPGCSGFVQKCPIIQISNTQWFLLNYIKSVRQNLTKFQYTGELILFLVCTKFYQNSVSQFWEQLARWRFKNNHNRKLLEIATKISHDSIFLWKKTRWLTYRFE